MQPRFYYILLTYSLTLLLKNSISAEARYQAKTRTYSANISHARSLCISPTIVFSGMVITTVKKHQNAFQEFIIASTILDQDTLHRSKDAIKILTKRSNRSITEFEANKSCKIEKSMVTMPIIHTAIVPTILCFCCLAWYSLSNFSLFSSIALPFCQVADDLACYH